MDTGTQDQVRELMAKRAAQELRDGYYVNLGIGIPTLVANFVPQDIEANARIIQQTTERGAVLLKNDGVLPLPQKAMTLAIIGPSWNKARLGGYTCDEAKPVSPYDGIAARAPKGSRHRRTCGRSRSRCRSRSC